MATVEGHVGPVYAADGIETSQLRQGRYGELITGQYGGKYKEAVRRGNVYSGTTAVTGVAPGTALGTTAAFALYNPSGNSKNLVVQKLAMGFISGTLGAGVVNITGDNSSTAVPTGTAITPRNRLIGAANNSSATCLTTATVTTQAAKMAGILCNLYAAVITSAINNEIIEKDVDGEIIIQPGCLMCLHATAAGGTSPLVIFSATWEEETV